MVDKNPRSKFSSIIEAPTKANLPLHRLAPEVALRRLELTIVRRLEGFLHGDHQGLLPGPGAETNDARPYIPGQDDVRRMDWAVSARTGNLHVRDTIADRELEIWGLLDATPSMNWGTQGITKRELGIAALATIGFLGQKVGDRFGAFVMHPDRIHRLPARSGRSALYGLLRKLISAEIAQDSVTGKYDLAAAITQLSNAQRRRGLKIIVSDFSDPDDTEINPDKAPVWEQPLKILAARNQVLCVEVVDPFELEFPDLGELLIRGVESNYRQFIDTSNKKSLAELNKSLKQQRIRNQEAMKRAGVAHLRLRTDRDWVQDIARFVYGYRQVAAVIHQPPQGVMK